MGVVEEARSLRELILEFSMKSEDKTLAIGFKKYFETWKRGKFEVGDVRLHPQTKAPYECIMAHDSTLNPTWDISVRTLWKPYHSRKKEYALPWEQPTGSHDMYLNGEYMIWTDGEIYHCLQDTNFNPSEYSGAWEEAV